MFFKTAQRDWHGRVQKRHGYARVAEYKIWQGIIRRCLNRQDRQFTDYGGRGILICQRWREGEGNLSGFQCFLADMMKRPTAGHTIDRIDNDGNYEPGNCRWATAKQQARNRRTNKFAVVHGIQMTLSEIAEKYGFNVATIESRYASGWRGEKLIVPPNSTRQLDTCKRGHSYAENSVYLPRGGRVCRQCRNLRNMEYEKRKRIAGLHHREQATREVVL